MKELMRLDKYLADMGAGTRSEVKLFIKKGRVQVNNEVVTDANRKIETGSDIVCLDGRDISYVHYEYFMLNKPAGVLSATEDKRAETVIDLITTSKRKDLFPVGRLDKDTEGLLLITNDGALTHSLLSPKKHVDKKYYAKVEGVVTEEDIELFSKGLQVDDEFLAMPAKLTILSQGELSEIILIIQEGKFHQVKRMFEAVGKTVVYLKRLSMGSLQLDESLQPGEYREVTEEELALLR
ncbi:pseudouridine synthase [Anaerosporobacter sp.]|uniref:pseudouridine synthase n=1 Tax=Anaerosporobacter sp. TaxID=1872529 RepID=UPI00286F352F|nr:pseudouridine synthase [Anaerosporobacter sp.]